MPPKPQTLEEILKSFDEQFPCIVGACDSNGTICVNTPSGPVPDPCQVCFELRLPIKKFIQETLSLFAESMRMEEDTDPNNYQRLETAGFNEAVSRFNTKLDNFLKGGGV